MHPIYIIGPRTRKEFKKHIPKNPIVNTTSMSDNWSRGLSPFFLGPVNVGKHVSCNVENAWQYSKVYEGQTKSSWFKWALGGWATNKGVRYPMGKGSKPMFSYWKGLKLDYISARKNIYIPLYAQSVVKTKAFEKLKSLHRKGPVVLWDFDGYDYIIDENTNLEEVLKDETKIMGHAFVLAMLLKKEVVVTKKGKVKVFGYILE